MMDVCALCRSTISDKATCFCFRYDQVVASDSTSTVLVEKLDLNSTTNLVNPLASFVQGTAKLTELVVAASSFGIIVPIKLSIPGDSVVAPTSVDLAFAAQCTPGYVEATTAQGNRICTSCEIFKYEHNGKCEICKAGMVCEKSGLSLSVVSLASGFWRTNDESNEIHKCPFGVTSCPDDDKNQASLYSPSQRRATSSGKTTGLNPYCSPNHVGHLCSACAPGFFCLGFGGAISVG